MSKSKDNTSDYIFRFIPILQAVELYQLRVNSSATRADPAKNSHDSPNGILHPTFRVFIQNWRHAPPETVKGKGGHVFARKYDYIKGKWVLFWASRKT